MIRRFLSGMPVKRHRRQLRIFDDCFTGREAVDFMMNELPKFIHDGREITRWVTIFSLRCSTRSMFNFEIMVVVRNTTTIFFQLGQGLKNSINREVAAGERNLM